jgi:opacity protein-like surface antigen
MTRTLLTLTAAAAATAFLAGPVDAQERWGVDLHATGGIATQDDIRDDSENGFGFGATLQYRVLPHVFLYGGWDWTHYQALEAIAGPDMDLEETGYALGARFEHPIGSSSTNWWVRAGALYNHFELEDDDGDLVDDSGHGLGWEAGAGVAVELGSGWSLTPGLRYRSVSRDVEIDAAETEIELQAVALEVGIRRIF